jgi:hypothetical protein
LKKPETLRNQALDSTLSQMVYTDVYGKALRSEARRIHPSRVHLEPPEQFKEAIDTITQRAKNEPGTMQGLFLGGVHMVSTQVVAY